MEKFKVTKKKFESNLDVELSIVQQEVIQEQGRSQSVRVVSK